jgi:hypothetical protein
VKPKSKSLLGNLWQVNSGKLTLWRVSTANKTSGSVTSSTSQSGNTSIRKTPEWVQKIYDAEEKFWKEYPHKTHEEKIKIWSGSLHMSMRSYQETVDNDPYRNYDEEWLRQTLQHEPDFLKLLPEIYGVWSGVWDQDKIHQKIMAAYKKLQET